MTSSANKGNKEVAETKKKNIDGLVQGRRNSIANALELRLSCTNPSICYYNFVISAVPGDGIVPLGVETSTGKLVVAFGPYM